MKILDATCGFKGIWYIKDHPFVTFLDKRKERIYAVTENMKLKNRRSWVINPDVVCKWEDAPFPDNYFDMIVFDPPHIVWVNEKKECALDKKYGYYKNREECKREIKKGIAKLFKILKNEGVFIFKWSEGSIDIEEMIKLFPYRPLFGTNTKGKGKTANYWILFLKYRLEKSLEVN